MTVATNQCVTTGCDRAGTKRGMCKRCYLRWWRGTPVEQRTPTANQVRQGLRAAAWLESQEEAVAEFAPAPAVDYGDPRIPARFWTKVYPEPNTGCWLWAGSTRGMGYGGVRYQGRLWMSHRLAYVLVHGDLDSAIELDHLCRQRLCVAPHHLQPVSGRVNILRGEAPTSLNARKAACTEGHLYTDQNTYWDTDGGRECRTCRRAARARYAQKKRRAA